eukprot:3570229-Rhodomonas_salina.1
MLREAISVLCISESTRHRWKWESRKTDSNIPVCNTPWVRLETGHPGPSERSSIPPLVELASRATLCSVAWRSSLRLHPPLQPPHAHPARQTPHLTAQHISLDDWLSERAPLRDAKLDSTHGGLLTREREPVPHGLDPGPLLHLQPP